MDNKRTTNGQQTDTSKKLKNSKEGKEVKHTTSKKFNPKDVRPDYAEEVDWNDFVLHRKKAGGTETARAYTMLMKQFKLAVDSGYSFKDVVDVICYRGWRGFQFEWLGKDGAKKQNTGQTQPFSQVTMDNIERTRGWADE